MKLRATGFETTPHDTAECRRALAVLIGPGATFELRALPAGRSAICRSADEAISAIREFAHAAGVYYTLNPLRDGLDHAARNGDVISRVWLLIDVDPTRPADLSSTDNEKATAARVACAIVDDLAARSWPAPILVDSGNGFHVLYRVDLPNTKLAQQWVKRVLIVLAERHDTEAAHVDRSVHNAARIAKLPGTWARKGPDTPDRPHRLARLAMVPEEIGSVTLDQIKSLIGPDESPDDGSDTGTRPGTEPGPFRVRATSGSTDAYCRAALHGECARVALAPNQDRNNQLNRSAFALGSLIHLDGFARSEAEAQLAHAARRAGLGDREIAATIRSGLDAGIMEPRNVPADGRRNGEANGVRDAASRPVADPPARLIIGLDEVEPEEVRWLWKDRIAIGFISLFAGQTGLGKSFVVDDYASRLSLGTPLPDGENPFPPSNTLIISEDPVRSMLAPRFLEMGADRKRIKFMTWEAMASYSMADTAMLERAYEESDRPILIIIDPPANFLGRKDEHKNAEVRSVVMALVSWLDVKKVACVLITHVNKNVGKGLAALDRIMGSVAWATTSRITVAFAHDPNTPGRCLCGGIKNNLGPKALPLSYEIVSTDSLAKVEWFGVVEADMDDALDGKGRTLRRVIATDWLIDQFRQKLSWSSEELFKVGKAHGVSRDAIFEAKKLLKLPKPRKTAEINGDVHWEWWVPPDWEGFQEKTEK